MRNTLDKRLRLYEPVEFILEFLKDRGFSRKKDRIAIHPTCSTRKMGLDGKLRQLAQLCAKEVVMPEDVYCGFAGDRGFNFRTQPIGAPGPEEAGAGLRGGLLDQQDL